MTDDLTGGVSETDEPALCWCGKGYVGHSSHDLEPVYSPMADEDLIADAAMEAENRWQNGRRDPESWRERGPNNDGYGYSGDGVSGRTGDPDDLASTDRLEARTASFDNLYGESSPRNPNPRCKECGERLKASPRAEVYLDATTMRRDAGGQGALVDEIPESAFGPYLVHQEPCYLSNGLEGTRKYALA